MPIKKKRLEITHNGLFLFGVIFYLIIPVVIHNSNYLEGNIGIDIWRKDTYLTPDKSFLYLVLVFGFLVSFLLGSSLGNKLSINPQRVKAARQDIILGRMLSYVLLVISGVFTVYFIVKDRSLAFSGSYAMGEGGDTGIISTINLFLFYINFAVKQPKFTKKCFFVLFILNSFFLLGLGGRMYVLIPTIAYILRAYNDRVAAGKSVLIYFISPVFGAIAAGLLGAIRSGLGFDTSLIAFFVFAEPVFTSYTSFSYIGRNTIPLFSFPYGFMVYLLEIIPSLFWPGKADFIDSLLKGWIDKFDSPEGALSVFVSIFGDFGSVFGLIAIFLFGMFFGNLYKSYKKGTITKNTYYCFCCVLPFCFFRDPIGIPIKIYILSFTFIPFLLRSLVAFLKKDNHEVNNIQLTNTD